MPACSKICNASVCYEIIMMRRAHYTEMWKKIKKTLRGRRYKDPSPTDRHERLVFLETLKALRGGFYFQPTMFYRGWRQNFTAPESTGAVTDAPKSVSQPFLVYNLSAVQQLPAQNKPLPTYRLTNRLTTHRPANPSLYFIWNYFELGKLSN